MTLQIILASQSPRRKELLQYIAEDFEIVTADIDETVLPNESPEMYVQRLSLSKAQKVASSHEQNIVIGADTTVVYKNNILGKPENIEECRATLSMLSGKTHQVFTSFSVVSPSNTLTQIVKTDVTFRAITSEEIDEYWHTGEPQDKAGAYGIQGIGGKFVTRVNGSVSSVIGLPLAELDQALKVVTQ